MTIKRSAPYGGILHEVVEHNGTLYLAGIVSEDLSVDMTGQAEDVMRQLGPDIQWAQSYVGGDKVLLRLAGK